MCCESPKKLFIVFKELTLITFIYIIAKTVQIILSLASFAMLMRVLIPFFTDPENNRFYILCAIITEPFIVPIRVVMAKLGIGQNSMIDWPFFVGYIFISLLNTVLPMI